MSFTMNSNDKLAHALLVQYSALGQQVWVHGASMDVGRAFFGLYRRQADRDTNPLP